jgi:hypothetical protein
MCDKDSIVQSDTKIIQDDTSILHEVMEQLERFESVDGTAMLASIDNTISDEVSVPILNNRCVGDINNNLFNINDNINKNIFNIGLVNNVNGKNINKKSLKPMMLDFSPGVSSFKHGSLPVLGKKRRVNEGSCESGEKDKVYELVLDSIFQRLASLENQCKDILEENKILRETVALFQAGVDNKLLADQITEVKLGLNEVKSRLDVVDVISVGECQTGIVTTQPGPVMMDMAECNESEPLVNISSDGIRGNKRISLSEVKVVQHTAAELEDRKKRCKNIVISGLDFSSVSSVITVDSVLDSFFSELDTCVNFTVVKKVYDDNRIKAGLLRMIVIKVDSETIRDELLTRLKHRLKNRKIFINKDKSPMALRFEYDLRKVMRGLVEASPEGDKDKIKFYIKNGAIFKYGQGVVGHVKVHQA